MAHFNCGSDFKVIGCLLSEEWFLIKDVNFHHADHLGWATKDSRLIIKIKKHVQDAPSLDFINWHSCHKFAIMTSP